MKTNLTYPKIPYGKYQADKCIAFEKYDGTNLHWVWDNGWKAFGTRRTQFSFDNNGYVEFCKEHPGLEEAYPLFLSELADELAQKLDSPSICFTEFWGRNSFAGNHQPEDNKLLTLIDVQINNDLLLPEEFLKLFGDLPQSARVVYQGKFTGQFTQDVRMGKYSVNEGVVCKGVLDGKLHMAKYKTEKYLNRK